MPHRIVILGAGYAGIEAALHLNKKGRKDDLEIVLIDRHPYHTLLTEIHEVAGNRVSEDSVRIPLKDIFRDTRVQLVQDHIVRFDFEGKTLASDTAVYPYDHLMIAIGSTPNFYGIQGMAENALTLWSFEDAVRIRDHIKECFYKASVEKDEMERARLLSFVVGGAGFTGVEMVGELAHWTRALAKENDIPYSEVRVVVVDLLDRVLPVLDVKNSQKAHRHMQKMGIEVLLSACINELTPEYVDLGDDRIQTRTLIWAAGVRAAHETDALGLPTVGGARRIQVDSFCRTGKPGVYAIGDVGALSPEGGKPYPAMVEAALQTGDGAADNILAELRGKQPKKIEVKFHGIMVCIGNFFAVSDIMGKRLPSWLSLTMKFLVNCHYLYGIRGLAGPWNYLHDEILFRRQKQSFLQRHYTKMQPAWWGTLLRMFLGGWWLWEGIKKITDGWFTSPKLASFLGMSADAGAGASAAGQTITSTSPNILNINLYVAHFIVGTEEKFNLVISQALRGMEDITGLAGVTDLSELYEKVKVASTMFFSVKLFHFGDFDLVSWLLRNVVLATDGLAMFFQVLVVIMEILVGLMLLGGCFTFLGSVISFALMVMFITSTGIYEGSWWMVFASIACMGGVGRAFGLDAYVLPWLNRVWDYSMKNNRLKLFFGKKRRA